MEPREVILQIGASAAISLGRRLPEGEFIDILTGRTVRSVERRNQSQLLVADLFHTLPVALVECVSG